MAANLSKNQKEALNFHNQYRALHGCSTLSWDNALEKRAKDYAKYLASINNVHHDEKTKDGENIIVMKGGNLTGKLATDCWYKEIQHFDFDDPKFNYKTGHFTQIVWGNTKNFGYGEAISNNGTIYVVARYLPPGNVEGEFGANVPTPKVEPQIQAIPPGFEGFSVDEFSVFVVHNELRQRHGLNSLTWSAMLKNEALKLAENFNDIDFEDQVFFELLFETEPDVSEVIETWFEEGSDYDYSTEPDSTKANHFTQIIWKNTKEIGFAKVSQGNKWIMVVLYEPKGNIEGQYKENIFPPQGKEYKEKVCFFYPKLNYIQQKALDIHNRFRNLHMSPPLKWSKLLSEEANGWAEILLSQDCIKKQGKKRGENIGLEWDGREDPQDIIDKWYFESKYYNYLKPRGCYKTDSFTQIVWKSTKYMGFASLQRKDGIRIYVAKYWPPGNLAGLFEENISPNIETKIEPPIFLNEYCNAILKNHNKLRKKHRSQAIKLSSPLSALAEEIAKFLVLIKLGKVTYGHHSKNGVIFNYLFSHKGNLPNPEAVCYIWYNTLYYFRYDNDDMVPESAPFREMIWNSTSEMGVGAATADNFCVVIATYNRPVDSEESVFKNIKRPLISFSSLVGK